jgi:hypothetical protein
MPSREGGKKGEGNKGENTETGKRERRKNLPTKNLEKSIYIKTRADKKDLNDTGITTPLS